MNPTNYLLLGLLFLCWLTSDVARLVLKSAAADLRRGLFSWPWWGACGFGTLWAASFIMLVRLGMHFSPAL